VRLLADLPPSSSVLWRFRRAGQRRGLAKSFALRPRIPTAPAASVLPHPLHLHLPPYGLGGRWRWRGRGWGLPAESL